MVGVQIAQPLWTSWHIAHLILLLILHLRRGKFLLLAHRSLNTEAVVSTTHLIVCTLQKLARIIFLSRNFLPSFARKCPRRAIRHRYLQRFHLGVLVEVGVVVGSGTRHRRRSGYVMVFGSCLIGLGWLLFLISLTHGAFHTIIARARTLQIFSITHLALARLLPHLYSLSLHLFLFGDLGVWCAGE